jgi:hypothetical protein
MLGTGPIFLRDAEFGLADVKLEAFGWAAI